MTKEHLPFQNPQAQWLALCFLLTACASNASGRRPTEIAPSATEHPADIHELVTTVDRIINDREADPPAHNTYSHETAYGPDHLAKPRVHLMPTEDFSALASTDCSGWVSFVMNTVSPLHEAVLQSQRRLPEYNQVYSDGFELKERQRPWPRAFVLTNYFRSEHSQVTGFERVERYEDLELGDLAAYSMGRYTDPPDTDLMKPKDTGHTFIIVGSPTIVDPSTPGYDGEGTLSRRADKVIAVPIIDASSTPHYDPDSRKSEQGEFTLPPTSPFPKAKAGGIGEGTAWFVLDRKGRVLQRRLGPSSEYFDVVIGAARLRESISLVPHILDDEGYLVVEIFDNTPSEYGGTTYGRLPIDLHGEGGIRFLGTGPLFLNGDSDFTGGVIVESGELVADSETALGTGDIEIRGGSLRLNHAAIDDRARLRLSDKAQDAAVHLGFTGTDSLQTLQIGDTVHTCGTWGGIATGATFVDPRFSGPGMLELTADPSDECKAKGR
jgi:autotransporter-associated beta strand protein